MHYIHCSQNPGSDRLHQPKRAREAHSRGTATLYYGVYNNFLSNTISSKLRLWLYIIVISLTPISYKSHGKINTLAGDKRHGGWRCGLQLWMHWKYRYIVPGLFGHPWCKTPFILFFQLYCDSYKNIPWTRTSTPFARE